MKYSICNYCGRKGVRKVKPIYQHVGIDYHKQCKYCHRIQYTK